jgi:hypothetical protein
MSINQLTTRCKAERVLTEAGVEGVALQALLKETAGCRHEWRTRQVEYAVNDAAQSAADAVQPNALGFALTLLTAEICGVGGKDDVGGQATARMAWAQSLGKGRKQASDGGAWTSAIESCAEEMFLRTGAKITPEGIKTEHGLADWRLVPDRWMMSVAREGLRRSWGLYFWNPGFLPFDLDALGWAKKVNEVAAEVATKEKTHENNG